MPRYRLTIEYHGGRFYGFQRQDDRETVQGCLEKAFRAFTGGHVTVHCAGRTDSGVHASGQVIHVDLSKPWEAWKVQNAINHHIQPAAISVLHAAEVRPEFDARRHAICRAYRYRILNRRSPPAMQRGLVWHVPYSMDVAMMQEAAQHLVGHHDFTSFRAAGLSGEVTDEDTGPADCEPSWRGSMDRGGGALLPLQPDPHIYRHLEEGG